MKLGIHRPTGLHGYEGVTAAVIWLAAEDALSEDPAGRSDAVRYLGSDSYRRHIAGLGLSSDMLPEMIEDLGSGYAEVLDGDRDTLSFWLTSDAPAADIWRQTAPLPELLGALVKVTRSQL